MTGEHHASRGTLIRRRLLEKKLRVGTGRLREEKLLLEKGADRTRRSVIAGTPRNRDVRETAHGPSTSDLRMMRKGASRTRTSNSWRSQPRRASELPKLNTSWSEDRTKEPSLRAEVQGSQAQRRDKGHRRVSSTAGMMHEETLTTSALEPRGHLSGTIGASCSSARRQ